MSCMPIRFSNLYLRLRTALFFSINLLFDDIKGNLRAVVHVVLLLYLFPDPELRDRINAWVTGRRQQLVKQ